MAEAKKEMSFEDWKRVGELTKSLRYEIQAILLGCKKSSREARWLRSALDSIDKVKDKLDNVVFEKYPEKPVDELGEVFYGTNKDS